MKYEGMAAVAVPRQARVEARLQQAMVWLMAAFVFSLPLVEAPKNIVGGLFLLAWVAQVVLARNFGGPWNRYDTAFALMLGAAGISAAAGYAGDLSGVFRVYAIGWALSRSRLPASATRPLIAAACLGLMIGIPMGAFPFLMGSVQFLELPSVGQVNQSALYIAILTAAAFGWSLQGRQDGLTRKLLGVCAVVFCLALLVGASRGAIVACVAAAGVIVLGIAAGGLQPLHKKILKRAALVIAALAVVVAGLTAIDPNLSDRKLTLDRIATTYSMSSRMTHWRIAYEGWRQRPWLGWGPESFQRLKVEQVCAWRQQRGEDCDTNLYATTKHAHSLYIGTLAERGLVGIFALAVLLAVWAWSLVRGAGAAARSPWWVASASGFVIAVVGGVFNTTLRVEHGSLALVFFGLWIAADRFASRRG